MAATRADSTSRVRARAIGATTVDQRVRFIAGMMSAGTYRLYETRQILSEVWGVEDATVRGYAAEAHRLVSFDPDQREQLRRTAASQLERIARKAERMTSRVTGLPDFNAAINARLHALKCHGVELDERGDAPPAPPKIEIVLAPEPEPDADRPEQVPGAEPGVARSPTG